MSSTVSLPTPFVIDHFGKNNRSCLLPMNKSATTTMACGAAEDNRCGKAKESTKQCSAAICIIATSCQNPLGIGTARNNKSGSDSSFYGVSLTFHGFRSAVIALSAAAGNNKSGQNTPEASE